MSDSRAPSDTANQRGERVAGTLSRDVAVESQKRSRLISPVQQRAVKKITPADAVKESRGREPRRADIWMPRIAGLAAVAIGAVISFTLVSGKPVAVPSAARAPSAMTIPARSKPAVVPPTSKPATNTIAVIPPSKVVARKDVVTKAAVQPTRENPAVEQGGAVPKIVDDKRGAETERTSGIASASTRIPSVPSEAEKTARGNDAGEQTFTVKPTEEQGAEARAAIEQEKAAVQAFLLAQEAGMQAKATRDAAAREQAAKEAAERARVARQNANRQFSNSFLGVK